MSQNMKIGLLLDNEDLELMVEINRHGIATETELVFATGDFSGDIPRRIEHLRDIGAITTLIQRPNVNYCVTGTGLEALYFNEAFVRISKVVFNSQVVNFEPFVLTQKQRFKQPAISKTT